MSHTTVVLVGTEPGGGCGGIQTTMAALRDALDAAGAPCEVVVSHRAVSLRGKFALAAGALRQLTAAVHRLHDQGREVVVYAQAGEWPSMARKATLLAAARAQGAHTVLHLRAPELEGYLAHARGRRFVRRTVHTADALLVSTDWWRARLRELDLGRPIAVVPNPLPRALEEVAHGPRIVRERDAHAPLRVLALTRLVRGKGVEDAIRAAIACRTRVHLTVAGDGPERRKLEALARGGLPPDRVAFPGWLGEEAVYRAYRDADVFCLPTTRDSFGMVLVEAMAHGLPVLARRWGPIPEVVPDGVAGTLVVDPVVPALACELDTLRDPVHRAVLGDGGRRWVREQLGRDRIGHLLRETLAGVTAARR